MEFSATYVLFKMQININKDITQKETHKKNHVEQCLLRLPSDYIHFSFSLMLQSQYGCMLLPAINLVKD